MQQNITKFVLKTNLLLAVTKINWNNENQAGKISNKLVFMPIMPK